MLFICIDVASLEPITKHSKSLASHFSFKPRRWILSLHISKPLGSKRTSLSYHTLRYSLSSHSCPWLEANAVCLIAMQKDSSLTTFSLNRSFCSALKVSTLTISLSSTLHDFTSACPSGYPRLDPSIVASFINFNPLHHSVLLFTTPQSLNSSLLTSKTLFDSLLITPARLYRQIHNTVVLYRDYHSPKPADRIQVREPLLVNF